MHPPIALTIQEPRLTNHETTTTTTFASASGFHIHTTSQRFCYRVRAGNPDSRTGGTWQHPLVTLTHPRTKAEAVQSPPGTCARLARPRHTRLCTHKPGARTETVGLRAGHSISKARPGWQVTSESKARSSLPYIDHRSVDWRGRVTRPLPPSNERRRHLIVHIRAREPLAVRNEGGSDESSVRLFLVQTQTRSKRTQGPPLRRSDLGSPQQRIDRLRIVSGQTFPAQPMTNPSSSTSHGPGRTLARDHASASSLKRSVQAAFEGETILLIAPIRQRIKCPGR